MKRTALLLVLVVAMGGFATRALADGATVTYTIDGTYNPGSPSEPMCEPGQNFSITMTLPIQSSTLSYDYVPGDDFYAYPVPTSVTFGGTTTQGSALAAFYVIGSISQPGGLFVDLCATDPSCATGLEYQWTFAGPQQYTGPESNPTLTPSNYTFSNQPFTVFDNTYTELDGSICGTVTAQVVSTPEPSSLLMLMGGLLAVGVFFKYRG
jgi:PEP-CTERM motif